MDFVDLDYFWWGSDLLGLFAWLNIVNAAVVLVGLRRSGFLRNPDGRRHLAAFTIISAIVAATTVAVSALGVHKWLVEVKPLKSGPGVVGTDLDWAGSGGALAIVNGWPLAIFALSYWRWRRLAKTKTAARVR